MTKLIVAFRTFAKSPTKGAILLDVLLMTAEEWKESIIVTIYKKAIKQNVLIIRAYHFCQLRTKLYPTSCCQGSLYMQRKLLGIINVDLDATGQQQGCLIKYSH